MMSHKDNNLSIQLFYETFDQAKSKIEKLKLTRDRFFKLIKITSQAKA
jgi:hypothetical protein